MQLVSLPFALLLASAPSDPTVAVAGDSLADRIGSDALLYVSLDTTRMVDGMTSLGIATLLDEPQVQQFLQPMAGELPVEISTNGLRQMIDSVPWREYVAGRVEIAVRGLEVEINGQRIELSATKPFDARALNKLGGLAHLAQSGSLSSASFGVDAVASIDAGPRFRQWFDGLVGHLRESGLDAHAEACRVAGHEAQRLHVRFDEDAPSTSVWFAGEGSRWWFSGSTASLERCLAPRGESLAQSASFRRWREQVTQGSPALEAYVNVAHVGRIFERLVPPIVKEELDLLGLTSIESLGLATTFVEGGVRDSLAISFAESPTGLLSLLDCVDGGFDFLTAAPSETGLFVGLRIAPEAMFDKLLTVSDQIAPGSARGIEMALGEIEGEVGMDVRAELLAAFGDEIGLYLTPPGAGGLLPDGMLPIEIGDREQFEKLLGRARGMLEQQGLVVNDARGLPEGCSGFTVVPEGAPLQPVFAATDHSLCIAPNVLALKSALKARENGRAGSALDNARLQRVLTALTGKPNSDGLSLLAFVDLERLVTIGYQFVPMAAGALQEGSGGRLDPAALPDAEVVASHFSGIGIAGSSNRRGLSLSFFTPSGLMPTLAAAAAWSIPVAVHSEPMLAAAAPAPAPTSGGKTLAQLFANLEKATGATIDFPDSLAAIEVDYKAKSADLETILAELSAKVGFRYEVRAVDGAPLVVITTG